MSRQQTAHHEAINTRRNYRFYLHRAHLEQAVKDLASTTGLEIGAMDIPFVETCEGACDFADFRTTEELRQLADEMDGHDPRWVVPVKYDLRNGYSSIEQKYDWIASSHVIEHIPDLIGWFQDLSRLLKPDGVIFIVSPDKRYTFDRHRRETSMTDVVGYHRRRLIMPCYEQLFDHHYYSTTMVEPSIIWGGGIHPPPFKNYQAAVSLAEKAEREFEDAHCSVFTPESFCQLVADLRAAGLIDLAIASMRPTQFGQMDFSAVLRRVD